MLRGDLIEMQIEEIEEIEKLSEEREYKQEINFLEEISEFTFRAKYAKYNEEEKRREKWEETIDRSLDMHINKFKGVLSKDRLDEITESFSLVKQKYVLPSMRSMQFGGIAIEAKNARIYNCAAGHLHSIRSFAEGFWLLLCLHPDTLVKTKNGNKKISDITLEDEVLTYDEKIKEFFYIKPSDVIENPTSGKQKIKFTLENGKEIKCTIDHKFLTSNRGWVEAQDLNDEDDLVFYDQ